MARRVRRIWAASLLALAAGSQVLTPAQAAEPLSSGGFDAALAQAHAAEPLSSSGFDAALAQADQRFVAGDLPGALQLLEPVCSQSDRPECAFALGAIQHGLGHCQEALLQYRRYRELAPAGEHRAEVDAALEDVESQCGMAPSTAATSPSTPSHPNPTSAPFLLPGLSLAATPAAAAPAVAASAVAASSLPDAGIPSVKPAPDSLNRALVLGSFALSGAAAASGLVFGILAAHSASRCDRQQTYDQTFIDECEHQGPRYQGLWQGFAVASAGFLGVGLSLWWFDPNSSAAVGVAAGSVPALQLRHRF
jgi:hypothetical protein